jgi:hypothetical protein
VVLAVDSLNAADDADEHLLMEIRMELNLLELLPDEVLVLRIDQLVQNLQNFLSARKVVDDVDVGKDALHDQASVKV